MVVAGVSCRNPAFMLTDSIMIRLVRLRAFMFTDWLRISPAPIQPPKPRPNLPRLHLVLWITDPQYIVPSICAVMAFVLVLRMIGHETVKSSQIESSSE